MGSLQDLPVPTTRRLVNEAAKPVLPAVALSSLAEYVEDYSPGGAALGFEESGASVTYVVPGNTLKNKAAALAFLYGATLRLIGYAYVAPFRCNDPPLNADGTVNTSVPNWYVPTINASGPNVRYFLRRGLPLCHPWFPWMVCTRIDQLKAFGPRGRELVVFRNELLGSNQNFQDFTTSWEKLAISATFTQPKYNIFADADMDALGVGNELAGGTGATPGRWVFREQEPSANFITIDQGSMVFTEGPANIVGKTFTAPGYAQPEAHQHYIIRWTQVPEEYVCDSYGNLPRFDAALQKVNSTTFLNRRPGTLLFMPYKVHRYRNPINWTDGRPRFWLDIEITLDYFDPPGLIGVPDTRTVFGHQTAPFGTTGYFGIQGAPGYANAGKPRFQSWDMNSLFYPLTAQEQ